MYSLVIFDCDGVLVDSERLSHTVLQEMLREMGVDLGFEETVERFIGASMPTSVRRITDLLGAPPPASFLKDFAARTKSIFEQQLTAVPGVEQLLRSLSCKYCVASNGNRAKVNFTLGHTGLLDRFAGRIFTSEDVQRPKPAPDLFIHCARTMAIDPFATVVVEDTPAGIAAARAAGMTAIGYAAMTPALRLQDAGAHAVAETMADVHALLHRAATNA